MNKPLSADELATLAVPLSDAPKVALMSKRQKLLRFAHVVRRHTNRGLWSRFFGHYDQPRFVIFHDLEWKEQEVLDNLYHDCSAFAAAAADPVLQGAGLVPDKEGNVTVGAAMRFFDLTQPQLHAFSCDCGGAITHAEMADRIERLAASA